MSQCQKIRGRRYRQCTRPARRVVQHEVVSVRWQRDDQGVSFPVRTSTTLAWRGCRAHAAAAAKHGARVHPIAEK